MGDLDKLIAAVEAGEWITGLHLPYELHTDLTWKAFNGSLDAALRLHQALLPVWAWDLCDEGEAELWPPDDPPGDWPIRGIVREQPARAWLLAILRALQAKSTPDADTAAIRHHERFGPLDEHGNPLDPRRRG